MEAIQEINLYPDNMTREELHDLLKFGLTLGATGTDPALKGANAMPLQGVVVSGIDALLADETPADYNTAADIAITWSGPYEDENGEPYWRSQLLVFESDDVGGTPDQILTGIMVTNAAADALLAASELNTPYTIEPDRPLQVILTVSARTPQAVETA
jgi:hypothetical protein